MGFVESFHARAHDYWKRVLWKKNVWNLKNVFNLNLPNGQSSILSCEVKAAKKMFSLPLFSFCKLNTSNECRWFGILRMHPPDNNTSVIKRLRVDLQMSLFACFISLLSEEHGGHWPYQKVFLSLEQGS